MVLEQLITNVKIKPRSLTHTIYKNLLKMDLLKTNLWLPKENVGVGRNKSGAWD